MITNDVSPYALPGIPCQDKKIIMEKSHKKSFDALLNVVVQETGVAADAIIGRRRLGEIVIARQIFCKVAKMHTKAAFREIGEYLGGRDHTTIIHNINSLNGFMGREDAIWELYIQVARKIDRPFDEKRSRPKEEVAGTAPPIERSELLIKKIKVFDSGKLEPELQPVKLQRAKADHTNPDWMEKYL